MQIKVVERTQEILVQEQEIQRRERELDSTVRRPAEAEKFKLEKLAEANKNKIIMESEAEAESEVLRGEAEAFSIEARAKAEAEKMAKKADAWKEYKEAAMLDMMLEAMPKVRKKLAFKNDMFGCCPSSPSFPKVAAEIAAPLSQAKKISMVSDASGELGASKLTGEVLHIVQSVPALVKNMTGVDISAQMGVPSGSRMMAVGGAGAGGGGMGPAGIGSRVSDPKEKREKKISAS